MCSSPAALRDMWSGADDGKPAQHGSHESMIGYLACGKKWDLRIFFPGRVDKQLWTMRGGE
jgi:hypothetical protein